MESTLMAIAEDDPDELDLSLLVAAEAGFESVALTPAASIVDLVAEARSKGAGAVLCDHQLGFGGFASFDGASAVAAFYSEGVPAVLVTTFVMDADVSVRLHRDRIPVLLSRDELSPERLAEAVDLCRRELRNDIPADRRPHRALVRILRVDEEGRRPVVDAVVPQWQPHVAVRFPLDCIPQGVRPADKDELRGMRFLASVNTGAETDNELFFKDFEVAPEPPDVADLE